MNKKTKKLQAARAADEAAVIQHCIAAATMLACTHAAYSIDPDPESESATTVGIRCDRKAYLEVRAAAALPAVTPAAISAKARLALMLIEDDKGFLREELAEFFQSFATSVNAYCGRVIHSEWAAGNSARENLQLAEGGEVRT